MDRTCQTTSFKALVMSHFVNAFCDNLFKTFLSFYAMKVLLDIREATKFVSLVTVLFILPFIVFSPFGGYLADRFHKRNVIVVLFGLKVFVALLAAWGLAQGNLYFLGAVLFLFELGTALYVPSRSGLLAESLEEGELSKGNGYMQMTSFVGIIVGTALAGVLFNVYSRQLFVVGLLLAVLMLLTFLISVYIKLEVKEHVFVDKDILGEFIFALKGIYRDEGLLLTMLALAFFNFIGSIFQMNILVWGAHIAHIGEIQTSLLLLSVTIGIALGSVLAGGSSGKKIDIKLVPIGGLGIALMTMLLGVIIDYRLALGFLFLLGISGGFFSVPLNAYFQFYSPPRYRGMYLSVLEIVTAVGFFQAGGFLWLVGGKMGVMPDKLFTISSVLTMIATAIILHRMKRIRTQTKHQVEV